MTSDKAQPLGPEAVTAEFGAQWLPSFFRICLGRIAQQTGSVDVIDHVTDCRDFFLEAFNGLKPAGKVCTETDSDWIIRNRALSPAR